ncbi:MAG: hypothetical protein ACPF9D_04635 [Owenweeksia sp.]
MKSTIVFTILVCCLLAVPVARAQDDIDEPATVTPITELDEPSYLRRSAIALNLSSLGLGLEYAYNFNTHLNGRVRLNYFSLSDYQRTVEISDQPVLVTANANVFGADLAVEYLPFSSSSFKLVGGFGMFFNADLTARVNYEGELEYGDITLSEEEIGDITVGMDYSGFAPYMGLGFGRAVPKKRVGFGIEIGTYYAGSPEVSLEATKMFEPTATEEKEQLEENLSGYQWLPYLNLRLAIKL